MIGLNHAGWTTRHLYDGQDFIKILENIYEQRLRRGDPARDLRLLKLAIMMDSIPAHYYDKYFFETEMLTELKAAPFTRAQEIMRAMPDYWTHYKEQSETHLQSVLDQNRSRGGIHELELAIDAMDAVYNDRNEIMPVNIPNRDSLGQRIIPDFEEGLVVEVPALVNKDGFTPISQPWGMPRQTLGLVHRLAEYQYLTAIAAWKGDRQAAIQALLSNPLVRSLDKAERMYDEMARAHKRHLPRRLLRG
jgi:6-phospho-beta-glucosidase